MLQYGLGGRTQGLAVDRLVDDFYLVVFRASLCYNLPHHKGLIYRNHQRGVWSRGHRGWALHPLYPTFALQEPLLIFRCAIKCSLVSTAIEASEVCQL